MSGFGPPFMKIWTCGSSPQSGSQKAWKRQRCQLSEQLLEFFRRDPNNFLSWLVTMDKTWLYHYDPETKQQSMEWWHSGSPRPKKFRVQKSAGKVLASIFWDQDSILLNDYLPNGQTINAEYCLSLLMQLKDILKGKVTGRSPRGSCSCTPMPRVTRHLQPWRNWPTWASSALITHRILQIWPHSVPWTEKNNWKVAIFHLMQRSLLSQRPGWTDNILNFLWVACKS